MQEIKPFYLNTPTACIVTRGSRYCGTNVSPQLCKIFQSIRLSVLSDFLKFDLCIQCGDFSKYKFYQYIDLERC